MPTFALCRLWSMEELMPGCVLQDPLRHWVDNSYIFQSSIARTNQFLELPMLGKFSGRQHGRLGFQRIPKEYRFTDEIVIENWSS